MSLIGSASSSDSTAKSGSPHPCLSISRNKARLSRTLLGTRAPLPSGTKHSPDRMSDFVDQPRTVRTGEELDHARLEPFLLRHFPESTGPLTVEQFPSGHSNLTYLVHLGRRDFVLRRPPFGSKVRTAPGMSREY